MAGNVVLVRFGDFALEMLRDAIKSAQDADSFAPVTVIVPTRRAGVNLKRALCSPSPTVSGLAGLVNVHFVVLSDVAEVLGLPGALQSGRVRLTRIALGAAVRHVLGSNPGFLEPIAGHPSTEAQLVESYENLRDARPDALSILERRGRRQRDLARLCAAVRRLLEPDYFDDVDLARFAIERIHQGDIDVLGSVIVHLPSRSRNCEVELIAAIARVTSCTVHLGRTSTLDPDEILDAMLTRLVGAGFEFNAIGEQARPSGDRLHVEVTSAPDQQREVDAALRITIAALEKGVRADQITWSYCSRDPYARLITHALGEAGLAWNGPSPQMLDESPLARFVVGLLDLAIDGSSRAAVMAWLASSPVQDNDGRAIPFGEWERASRLAGIVDEDLASWRARLGSLVDFVEAELKAMASFDGAVAPRTSQRTWRRKENAARTIEATRGLLRFLDPLDRALSRSKTNSTFSGWSLFIFAAIDEYLGLSLDKIGVDTPPPTGEVLKILDELSRLDHLEPSCDAARFRAAFVGAVAREAPPIGSLGSGITVGPLEAGLGTASELVVVIGASEGALPRPLRRSCLMSGADEAAIGLQDGSVLAHLSREQRRFLACLGSARRRVVLSPDHAVSGRANVLRSRFVSELEGLDELVLEPGEIDDGVFVSESALVLELLSIWRERDGDQPPAVVVAKNAQLARARAAISSHDERRFDAFAGNIAHLSTDLAEEIFSPTTLETYAKCPFQFFLGHELGIEAIEPPEARMGIDPRSRGALVHTILERFVRAQLPASHDEGDGDKDSTADELEEIAQVEFDKLERRGVVGRRLFWERDRRRILEVLRAERARDERRQVGGTTPVAVELVFGTTDLDPVAIEVGERTVLFRGKVDRVDRNDLGQLDVIDYKTGRMDDYKSIGDDPVDKGRHLQLPIYGLAVRAWAASSSATVARSAFRFLDANGQEVDVALDERTQRRFEEVLQVLIGSIEAGAFPVHPGSVGFGGSENCRRCDFDEVCRSNRSAVWESVRLASSVREYASLVSGEDDE